MSGADGERRPSKRGPVGSQAAGLHHHSPRESLPSPRTPRSLSILAKQLPGSCLQEDDGVGTLSIPLAGDASSSAFYGTLPRPDSLDSVEEEPGTLSELWMAVREGRLRRVSSKMQDEWRQHVADLRDDMKEFAKRVDRTSYQNMFQSIAELIVSRKWFDYGVAGVVVLNCLVIGAEIDMHESLSRIEWILVKFCFNMCYTFEIWIRWVAHGLQFWKVKYNVFTFVVTTFAWLEIATTLCIMFADDESIFAKGAHHIPSDLIQMLRMLSIVRVAQVNETFAVLLESMGSALKSLTWVAVLGIVSFYITACFGALFIGNLEEPEGVEPDPGFEHLRHALSTVSDGMFMMFELMLLAGWSAWLRPLAETHPKYLPVMMFFLTVANFFLLNLTTAVVVNNVTSATNKKTDQALTELEVQENLWMSALYERLRDLNQGDDVMKRKDFMHYIAVDAEVRSLMRKLRWHRKYVAQFFSIVQHEYLNEASLKQLLSLWKRVRQPFSASTCARFQEHLANRLDDSEQHAQVFSQKLQELLSSSTAPAERPEGGEAEEGTPAPPQELATAGASGGASAVEPSISSSCPPRPAPAADAAAITGDASRS